MIYLVTGALDWNDPQRLESVCNHMFQNKSLSNITIRTSTARVDRMVVEYCKKYKIKCEQISPKWIRGNQINKNASTEVIQPLVHNIAGAIVFGEDHRAYNILTAIHNTNKDTSVQHYKPISIGRYDIHLH